MRGKQNHPMIQCSIIDCTFHHHHSDENIHSTVDHKCKFNQGRLIKNSLLLTKLTFSRTRTFKLGATRSKALARASQIDSLETSIGPSFGTWKDKQNQNRGTAPQEYTHNNVKFKGGNRYKSNDYHTPYSHVFFTKIMTSVFLTKIFNFKRCV